MWMEKMRRGVLQVATDSGVRYVEPSLGERLQLLWTFRNFTVLSEEVLSTHERQLMSELCAEKRMRRINGARVPACIIGTVERPTAPPLKKSPQRAFAAAQRATS